MARDTDAEDDARAGRSGDGGRRGHGGDASSLSCARSQVPGARGDADSGEEVATGGGVASCELRAPSCQCLAASLSCQF
jgi:hypothetical protein